MVRSMAGLIVTVIINLYSTAEMIVAQRSKLFSSESYFSGRAFPHHANACERQVLKFSRHIGSWRCGKQQFVIFAAVESLVESGATKARRLGNFRRETGCLAEPPNIQRKAVAEVHGGGGVQALPEKTAEGEPRFGAQMAAARCRGPACQPQGRAAEVAGNIDRITGMRAIAAQRLAARYGPANDNVTAQLFAARQIATG